MACCQDVEPVPRVDPTALPAAGMSTKPRLYEPSMWEIMSWSQCPKKEGGRAAVVITRNQGADAAGCGPECQAKQGCSASCCDTSCGCGKQTPGCCCCIKVTCCCCDNGCGNGCGCCSEGAKCKVRCACNSGVCDSRCRCTSCDDGKRKEQECGCRDASCDCQEQPAAPPKQQRRNSGPQPRARPQPHKQPIRPERPTVRKASNVAVSAPRRGTIEEDIEDVPFLDEDASEHAEIVTPGHAAQSGRGALLGAPQMTATEMLRNRRQLREQQRREAAAGAHRAGGDRPQQQRQNRISREESAKPLFYRVRADPKGNDPASIAERRRRKAAEQAERAKREMIQNSRFLPDSSYKRYFRKPAFHLYGNKNIKPVAGGVVYGNYLASYNVNPLMHRATPKEEALFDQSKRTFKSAVRAYVAPVLHSEYCRSTLAQPNTTLEFVDENGEKMQLKSGADLAGLNRSVADVLIEERRARGQSSMDDECLDLPVGGKGRQLLDTAVSNLEVDSLAEGWEDGEEDDDHQVFAAAAGTAPATQAKGNRFRKLRNEIAWSALSSSQAVRPSTAGAVIGSRTRVTRRSSAQPLDVPAEPRGEGEMRGRIQFQPEQEASAVEEKGSENSAERRGSVGVWGPAHAAAIARPSSEHSDEVNDSRRHSTQSAKVWGNDKKEWFGRRVSTASEELLVKNGRIPAGRGPPLGMDISLDRIHDIRNSQDSSAVQYSMHWPNHK